MVGVSDVTKAGPGTCRLAWVAPNAGPHAGPWAAAKIRTFRLRMSRPRRPGQKVGPETLGGPGSWEWGLDHRRLDWGEENSAASHPLRH